VVALKLQDLNTGRAMIAPGYRLECQGSNPAGAIEIFFQHHVYTGSGAHPVSCPLALWNCISGIRVVRV